MARGGAPAGGGMKAYLHESMKILVQYDVLDRLHEHPRLMLVANEPRHPVLAGPFQTVEAAQMAAIERVEAGFSERQQQLWALAYEAVRAHSLNVGRRETDTLAVLFYVACEVRRDAPVELVFKYAVGSDWRAWQRKWEVTEPELAGRVLAEPASDYSPVEVVS